MRKTIYALGAVMALFSMASCAGNQDGKCCKSGECKGGDKVYTGLIPAADAEGVRYSLKLDYDDDKNCTEGDYDLIETYIVGDSLSMTGHKDADSFKSEGDFTVMQKDGKTYLKLIQDVKDSAKGSNAGPIYFLVDSDSTITMVNADLQLAADSTMNYTLKLVK